MSGPQRYPGASTAYWWQDRWGGSRMTVNTLVLHTTESMGLPDYHQGAEAPTLTAMPDMKGRRLDWWQHFDIDISARALENRLGGVETNTLNVVQVELGGTCDDAHRSAWGTKLAGADYVYWPEAPDWALHGVADFVRWLHRTHGIPLTAPPVWLAYGPDPRRRGVSPAAYGPSPARMTASAWSSFRGVCGHSHVPENDHGDPGGFPISKVLAMVAGTYTPEDSMTAHDVWAYKNADQAKASPKLPDTYGYLQGAYNTLGSVSDRLDQILAAVKVPASAQLDDAQVQALGEQLAASPTLAGTIAELVAEKIAARMQS